MKIIEILCIKLDYFSVRYKLVTKTIIPFKGKYSRNSFLLT